MFDDRKSSVNTACGRRGSNRVKIVVVQGKENCNVVKPQRNRIPRTDDENVACTVKVRTITLERVGDIEEGLKEKLTSVDLQRRGRIS